jgi:hypothetical protein
VDSWPDLPPTEQLLVSGGDARIALDPLAMTNKYGCAALPDPELLAFGSSTASGISAEGFTAADQLRQQLLTAAASEPAAAIYSHELERIRVELRSLCGLENVPGIEIAMATSGSDIHLLATQLLGEAEPVLAVMIEAAETGSDVPAALAGRHFGICATSDAAIREGATIDGISVIEVASVPVRLPDGQPRPTVAVDADVVSLVSAAVAQGRRVLLTLADVAKSGLIAPSPACAIELKQRYPDALDVMVDACQFRLAPATIRAYLMQGFLVALTGSKFLTGPTFSGALLIPAELARRLSGRPLPATLAAYSTCAEWPPGWDAANLPDIANFGLLLRWQAALAELRAFHALPEAEVSGFLMTFAHAVKQRLNRDPLFEALPVPQLDRRPLAGPETWDHVQTIFPFVLFHPASHGERRPLSIEETYRIYRQLQDARPEGGVRCQLGQPVSCGQRCGIPVSALRLCASARLVVEASADRWQGAARVIEKALLALEKTAGLVRTGSL